MCVYHAELYVYKENVLNSFEKVNSVKRNVCYQFSAPDQLFPTVALNLPTDHFRNTSMNTSILAVLLINTLVIDTQFTEITMYCCILKENVTEKVIFGDFLKRGCSTY